ncbi:hypothetical protein GIB67_041017 [Kingdonia uniflora]|uniref:Transposase MuDR plant domain-containing protein n=1 Tax=Kingdonia uniflora TaxID=39325 RepID=A0A7J7NC77_9MAGN|nr:hypothetical protein GIB67_041017 [Kingdonia uniflora]
MRRELKERFIPINYGEVAFGKLQTLKMGLSSLDDYTDQYYLLEARARLHETEQQRVSRYKSGLTKKLQEATTLQPAFCLAEIVQLAKQASKLHAQYRPPVPVPTMATLTIPVITAPRTFVLGMNGVQLYTIVHFGGDIVRLKIGSIVSYVGRSTKLTSLRAHLSYEDFVILLEETSKIRREDWLSTTKDTGSGRNLSTTKAGGPLRHNLFLDPEPEYKGYLETNGRWLVLCRFDPLVNDDDAPQSNESFKTIRTDVPSSNEPSIIQSNVHLSNEHVLTNVLQSNKYFQTIPTDVYLSNEPCISQSNIHLLNEPVLTNISPLNKLMLTNVRLSIEPEPIIGQTETSAEFWFEPHPEQVKDLLDFWFKSVAYTEDPYDFSKEFNIGDLYRDKIELKNRIRAYTVVNKFNLEHVLNNEYKIVVCCNCHKCSWRIYATRLLGSALFQVSTYCSVHTCIRVETEDGNTYKTTFSRWVASIIKQKLRKDPNYKPSGIIDDMQIHHNIDVTYNLAWRAKEKSHAEMRGSFEHAYQLLTSYFAEVRLVDPNFVFDIQTTSYSETTESWTYFLEMFGSNFYGYDTRFVVISDRNPEIINAVPKVFPFAIHTFCAFYISNNIKTTLESTMIVFWMAAEALTSIDFDKHMNAIRNTGPVIHSRHNRRSCKLLPIPSDDNTRPAMAPFFTMNTEPPVIPDDDVAISLY